MTGLPVCDSISLRALPAVLPDTPCVRRFTLRNLPEIVFYSMLTLPQNMVFFNPDMVYMDMHPSA